MRWTCICGGSAARLGLYNPATGLHIATFASERARADREQAARRLAETRADAAEAQMREMAEQIRRLRGD